MFSGRVSPRKAIKNKENIKYTACRNRATIKKTTSKTNRPATSGSANVRVVVRVRPPNEKEKGVHCRTVVKVVENTTLVFDPKEDDDAFFYHGFQQRGRDLLKKVCKNIQFNFDRVFGYDADNAAVFDESTKNLLQSLMDGYNCSVFVYGATGAGKTHTMLGNPEKPGITYLTMRELFRQIEELKNEREFELGITYLEVYNETVKDLLNPGAPLHLREDGKFCVCVAGIKLHRIKNPEELFTLLRKGNANRTQHPTDANAESSRSHAVFQVYVDMTTRKTGERRFAKLSMIDLAGSERGAATGCSGMRFTEGANINKSLLALGNCINSLADGQSHIPYRDSKLTRLLKDSLGGNCQTVMIANISPSSLNYEDTYNTLKYATRAKKIKSLMKKNVVNNELTIPQYAKLVENLNKEINTLQQQLKEQLPATITTCSCTNNENNPVEIPEVENKSDEPVDIPEADIIIQSPELWREQLQTLLCEKHALLKQIQRLHNSHELIKYRLKFKESSENTLTRLCLDNNQLAKGRNKIQSSVSTFQRQANSVTSNLQGAQIKETNLESKLNSFILEHQITTTEDVDLLKSEANLKTIQYELQVQHSQNLLELYQSEMDHKEKLMSRMAEILNYYYNLQNSYGHITDEMAEDYRSIIRTAQGIRSVTWLDQDPDDPIPIKAQDSGISVTSVATTPSDTRININQIGEQLQKIEQECLSAKRLTVKRKLYDANTIDDDVLEDAAPSEDKKSKVTNLDETIVLPKATVVLPVITINPDVINSSFSLNERSSKEKQMHLVDRSNLICAENMLPRVCKTITGSAKKDRENNSTRTKLTINKPIVGRTQRFPLRNKEPVQQKSVRTTKVLPSVKNRNNATTMQRI